jgi:hypothetical protein
VEWDWIGSRRRREDACECPDQARLWSWKQETGKQKKSLA